MSMETEITGVSLQKIPARIPMRDAMLYGDLTVPENAVGLVVFVQGNGRSRHHAHNLTMAAVFNKYKLATLLTDFSWTIEGSPVSTSLLSERLKLTTLWAGENPKTMGLPVGYFGADAGSAAALGAAARQPDAARALVLLNGRPDSARESLSLVKVPVQLIAAGRDSEGLRSSQSALKGLNGHSVLNVISYASQTFEEPGALEDAAELAALWFSQHLG